MVGSGCHSWHLPYMSAAWNVFFPSSQVVDSIYFPSQHEMGFSDREACSYFFPRVRFHVSFLCLLGK